MKRHLLAVLAAAAALSLAACASSGAGASSAESEPTVSEQPGGFPRVVEVPAGAAGAASELRLEAAPRSIAALDYESAEVVAALGLADRLVLVPAAVTNPALGGHLEEMAAVPHTIPVAMELDAETVIELQPDLVIMSPRHGAETTIGSVLLSAGVPSLLLPESWTDIGSVSANVGLIGEATGADAEAVALEGELESGLSADPGSSSSSGPRVLVLTNQAGRPFVTAGAAFPLELLELAGARSASDDLGIQITGPISVEQIVQADPDGILLIDMNGSGDRLFAEMLGNPAVAALPGAGSTLLVQGREVQALGLTATVGGLAKLKEWVGGLG